MTKQARLNRKAILAYFGLLFGRKKPALAARRFLNPRYRHHGPGCKGGVGGFVGYFSEYFQRYPDLRVKVRRATAGSEFVVLDVEVRTRPKARPAQATEFYRMKQGKISEHWHILSDPALVRPLIKVR